uniref:Uncharacterized protein n=1 Tax=Anguilla anguilla TaxID=7936 RepID=A0A0E9PZG9_ANGAN
MQEVANLQRRQVRILKYIADPPFGVSMLIKYPAR